MAKKKTIGEKYGEKIEEIDRLLFKVQDYEGAAKILGKLLMSHEGATSYQMMRIGDSAKFVSEKIAERIRNEN
ncbi:MAG: hypothetical protein WC788_05190 [Candidatus Paceibacterota bacterium]